LEGLDARLEGLQPRPLDQLLLLGGQLRGGRQVVDRDACHLNTSSNVRAERRRGGAARWTIVGQEGNEGRRSAAGPRAWPGRPPPHPANDRRPRQGTARPGFFRPAREGRRTALFPDNQSEIGGDNRSRKMGRSEKGRGRGRAGGTVRIASPTRVEGRARGVKMARGPVVPVLSFAPCPGPQPPTWAEANPRPRPGAAPAHGAG